MTKLLLGTAGWSYRDWIGPFYESESTNKLISYNRVFDTVEIDSTFYAYPSRRTVMGWLKYSKPDFVFTAKIPELITHKKRLDVSLGLEQDIGRFCDIMKPLQMAGKLGCLLIQLPPSRRFDIAEMERFFKILPQDFRYAIEFRHTSWMRKETWSLLKDLEIAYTNVDEPLLPPEIHITADFAYFRWHGRGTKPWYNYHYKSEELSNWIPILNETKDKVRIAYGYFNNHYHGYAVDNCLQVLEMLGGLNPRQEQARRRTQSHLTKLHTELAGPKITAFFSPEAEEAVQQMLANFIEPKRIEKMRELGDSEVSILDAPPDRIEADIRDYHITIDLNAREICHNCADWNRCIPLKQFCKHVGKLMLAIPKNQAKTILNDLARNKENWKFLPTISNAIQHNEE